LKIRHYDWALKLAHGAVAVPKEPSLEAFSKVVEAIYDSAVDAQWWRTALPLIAELTNSPMTSMGIIDHTQQRLVLGCGHGADDDTAKAYEKYSGTNPLFIAGHLKPVGDVYTWRSIIDDEEFYESKFYTDFCKPRGLQDLLGLHALKSGHRSGGISAVRIEQQPLYGESDMRIFRLLSPHVCRAFAISDALDMRTITSKLLEATLDALTTGVYLTDRESRVVYMNRSAERQVKTSNALRIVNNRIEAIRQEVRDILRKAISDAIGDEALATGGHQVALPDEDGAGYLATVLPLDRGERRNLSSPFAAAAALFVQDPTVVPSLPGEAFAKLYGLTGGELRVALALAPGLGLKEAADFLGIHETTAKTHLQRIFGKTGTSRQAELIQLLMAATPPVKAG
jgi:DNA-binding CsgD family transcriptional regulator/PAS domain-containing protein